MGLCIDLDDDHSIEVNRDSITFVEENGSTGNDQTIFGSPNTVEIDKVALLKLLKFFDDPINRHKAFGDVLDKYDDLIPKAENLNS
jgi:hypothetical protein